MEQTTKQHKKENAKTHIFGLALFLLLIFIDQFTKALADSFLDVGEFVVIIPDWLNITIIYNRGISYGMGAGADPMVKLAVILGTAVMMIIFTVFYFKLEKERVFMRVAVIFVVAGGVGNLIDRLYFQVWTDEPYMLWQTHRLISECGVRDMVDLSRFGFAVCNFADFFITGGAVMLVVALLFFDPDAIFPLGKYKVLATEQKQNTLKEETKSLQGDVHDRNTESVEEAKSEENSTRIE